MLDGGLPRNRSTLVTGGPGTGKSTLGMQFLQAGLDAGESCLFVSTEQTVGELRDSFADFEFDLDAEDLGFLTVRKLRGVDHDRRTVEVEFVPGGLWAAPSRRSQPPALKDHAHRSVGIDGLDRLCGGGLLRGAGVLLQHDGRANLSALFGTILAGALESDHDVTLVPTIGLRESRVRVLLDGHDLEVETLLEDGRLRVVDVIGAWDGTLPGVRRPAEPGAELRDQFAELVERSDRTNFALVNADAVVHALGVDEARNLGYFAQAQLLGSDDALVYVSNPETIPEMAAAFHRDAAEQVLETWIADDGLQYVSLRKSPCGFVGSTALVEYVDDPPYLRVQDPPQSRENPYAEE